jgi:hypothetical protein
MLVSIIVSPYHARGIKPVLVSSGRPCSVRARLTEAPRRWSCCGQITTARFPRRSNQPREVLNGSTRITATSTTTSMTDWWCTARRAQCSSAANRSFATASCSLNAASVRSCTEVQVRPSANAADHRASSIPFDSLRRDLAPRRSANDNWASRVQLCGSGRGRGVARPRWVDAPA